MLIKQPSTSEVANMSEAHITAGIYRHYKGQRYQVLYCARHSETEEWQVVYRCLYGEFSMWVRPFTLFTQQVRLENGEMVPRFALEIATEFTTASSNRV